MLSSGTGLPYRPGIKSIQRKVSLHKDLPEDFIALPIILFLERMIPSGWGSENFISFSQLLSQLESQDGEKNNLVYLQPNPWIRIGPNTWPFSIRDESDNAIPLEVWPRQSRHDSPRWIRSQERGVPLGSFSIRQRQSGTMTLQMEFHVDLSSPSSDALEDVERAVTHQVMEEQWETDWEHVIHPGKGDSFEAALALCAFQRAMLMGDPTFVPAANPQDKANYIRQIIGRAPGIEERNPIAANAISHLEKC